MAEIVGFFLGFWRLLNLNRTIVSFLARQPWRLNRDPDKSLAWPGGETSYCICQNSVNFLRRLALQKKKNLDDSSRLDVVEIARVPDMLTSSFPSGRAKDLSAPLYAWECAEHLKLLFRWDPKRMSRSQWVWREHLSVLVQNGVKPCQNMLCYTVGMREHVTRPLYSGETWQESQSNCQLSWLGHFFALPILSSPAFHKRFGSRTPLGFEK